MKLRKHRPGCYRLTLSDDRFAQIVKGRFYLSMNAFVSDDTGRHWSVEIRNTETGKLLRYAGVWERLSDATEAAKYVQSKEATMPGSLAWDYAFSSRTTRSVPLDGGNPY